MKVFGVTGWKNSGKTTLVERLVDHFSTRGLSVSTIKHAHHGFDIDYPETDSFRHRTAGARQVAIASAKRWAIISELQDMPEPDLDDLLARLDPVDLVIVEGYKTAPHPKIEARRQATAGDPLTPNITSIVAIAADHPVAATSLPVFDLDDISSIAAFILDHVGVAQ